MGKSHMAPSHRLGPKPRRFPAMAFCSRRLCSDWAGSAWRRCASCGSWWPQEFGQVDALPHVRLLGIDTDPEAIQAAGHGDVETMLRTYEMLLAKLHRPSHYLKPRDGKTAPDSWLNSKTALSHSASKPAPVCVPSAAWLLSTTIASSRGAWKVNCKTAPPKTRCMKWPARPTWACAPRRRASM